MTKFGYRIVTEIGSGERDLLANTADIIEAAAQINYRWIAEDPQGRMCILKCGHIEYASECEDVLLSHAPIYTGNALVRKKRVMCIDIVAMHMAILKHMGVPAWPVFERVDGKPSVVHIETGTPEWQFDPTTEIRQHGSAVLGQPECTC